MSRSIPRFHNNELYNMILDVTTFSHGFLLATLICMHKHTYLYIPISLSLTLFLCMDKIYSPVSKRSVSCEFETQYMCGYDTTPLNREIAVWERKYDSGFILEDGTRARGKIFSIIVDALADQTYDLRLHFYRSPPNVSHDGVSIYGGLKLLID